MVSQGHHLLEDYVTVPIGVSFAFHIVDKAVNQFLIIIIIIINHHHYYHSACRILTITNNTYESN